MNESLPRVAHALVVDICGDGHVVLTMKDKNDNDIAVGHFTYNQALDTVATMQRALIHIETREHSAIAGHA